jgi:hypothetical protein
MIRHHLINGTERRRNMKKIAIGALLLSVFGLANTAFAAGRSVSAAMEVSFVVQESCNVLVTERAKAAPTVACAYAAPVQVSVQPATAQAAPSQTLAGADERSWQIYF